MLFAIWAIDINDGGKARAAHLAAHRRYLADAGDRVKMAGPLLSSEGSEGGAGELIGSLIIIDAASEAAVKLFSENDPFTQEGVFERVEIKPFKPLIGSWGAGAAPSGT